MNPVAAPPTPAPNATASLRIFLDIFSTFHQRLDPSNQAIF